MKVFGLSEWDIKWKMSWDNYMLYLSSLPDYDDSKSTEPKTEVKDAADLF